MLRLAFFTGKTNLKFYKRDILFQGGNSQLKSLVLKIYLSLVLNLL